MSVEEALTAAPAIAILPPPVKTDEQLRAELGETIREATGYLVRSCDENGKFVYLANPDRNAVIGPEYNIIRHAGAVYSLGMAYEFDPRDDVLDAMLRSGAFLCREAVAPVQEPGDMAAVWSDPELEGGKEPREAKLGGAGLGLVGLMQIERVRPGFTPVEELRRLARFIVWMQKEDGGFYSKYSPEAGGRDDKWVSLYYPGEAALGLVMLYERDPSPEWFESARRAIAYLARIRRDKHSIEADHWALLATAGLLRLSEERNISLEDKEDVLRHARQVCESILSEAPRYAVNPKTAGCMTDDARTCPTATRLEGTLAALTFLPEEDADLRTRIEAAAHGGIAFLARAQIRSEPYAGGIPKAAEPSRPGDTRATEIRVDYVQHAASAMIQYDRLFRR